MTETELQTFADNYTSADFDKIMFDWNGQHGDNFLDNNYEFRMQLCEFLVPQLDITKLILIRDLFIELSKWAKEAWCVYNKYHLLAQQLLTRGGTSFIIDYLTGASQCFDTGLASGRVILTKDQKQNIFNFITNRLESESDEKTLKLLEFGKDRFKRFLHVD
ncbi:MAG: hypothetical protein KA536_06585 [Saprospiraceae bacterium]|nr:hypothetical protein [Saprospiraceae bacterium]